VPDSASTTARQWVDSYTQQIKVSVRSQTWTEWLNPAGEEISATMEPDPPSKGQALALRDQISAVLVRHLVERTFGIFGNPA